MSKAAIEAIQYAIKLGDLDSIHFLELWNEGCFPEIREQFPNAPHGVFDGAEVTPESSFGEGGLDAFCLEVVEELDKFRKDIIAQHKDSPDKYPLTLPKDNTGLWFEFFSNHWYGDAG